MKAGAGVTTPTTKISGPIKPGAGEAMHYDPSQPELADALPGAQPPIRDEDDNPEAEAEPKARPRARRPRAPKAQTDVEPETNAPQPRKEAARPAATLVPCVGLPVQFHTGQTVLPAILFRCDPADARIWDIRIISQGPVPFSPRYKIRHAHKPTANHWNFLPGWVFTGPAAEAPQAPPTRQAPPAPRRDVIASEAEEMVGEAVYLRLGGKEEGPYAELRVREMIAANHIGRNTLGRWDTGDWQRLSDLFGMPDPVQLLGSRRNKEPERKVYADAEDEMLVR